MTLALEDLLEAPTLPEAVSILSRRLEVEGQRREKFYDEITPEMKSEFINGEVIMHSPALSRHTATRIRLTTLLHSYVFSKGLGLVHDEKTLCVFPRNDYEPDVVFFGVEKSTLIHADTMKFPPPDFVCEILSDSTVKRDRGIKFQDYEAHGVQEYWIIDPAAEILEQYVVNAEGRYDLRSKSGSGDVTSAAVSGFMIPIRALFDAAVNFETLKRLIG